MSWHWPLRAPALLPDAPGQFGALRRHDIHTGVDLYCAPRTAVLAVEAGQVVDVSPFTGAHVPAPDTSPWWNDTWAVLVEGASGVVVYGELSPCVQLGQWVAAQECLGQVDIPVLKVFKGRPMVMLHLELLRGGSRQTFWWAQGAPCPEGLLDPSPFLQQAAQPPRYFSMETWDQSLYLPIDHPIQPTRTSGNG